MSLRRSIGVLLCCSTLLPASAAPCFAADAPTAQPSQPPAGALPNQVFGQWTIGAGKPDASTPAHYLAYVKSPTADLFGFGCDKAGQTPVYALFLSHQYLAGGSNPERELEYVIDRGRVRAAKWTYVERYAFMRDPDAAREIAADMTTGKVLDLRAFTYELFAVNAHFDIDGAKAAIETLYRDCRG